MKDKKVDISKFSDLFECKCKNRYSIEPHGNGHAIYWGRCMHRHGANIGHLTECNRKDLIEYFEKALNREVGNDKDKIQNSE